MGTSKTTKTVRKTSTKKSGKKRTSKMERKKKEWSGNRRLTLTPKKTDTIKKSSGSEMESFVGNERAQCVLDISFEKLQKYALQFYKVKRE
jgi:hypothetical protein